jgi:hypothetical protein
MYYHYGPLRKNLIFLRILVSNLDHVLLLYRKIDFRSFGDIFRTIWKCVGVEIGFFLAGDHNRYGLLRSQNQSSFKLKSVALCGREKRL